MITNNLRPSRSLGISVGIFLFSIFLGYYGGKCFIPFACWLSHGLVSFEQVFPFVCLGIIVCGIAHLLYKKKKKIGKNPIVRWLLIALGIGFGGVLLIQNEGNWSFNYKYGYSKIKDRGTQWVSIVEKERNEKIGLINKWGTKVVPITCDGIYLYTDYDYGEDSFMGIILRDDSLKLYSFIDGKGVYRETIPLDLRENITNLIESKYGTVKYEFYGDMLWQNYCKLKRTNPRDVATFKTAKDNGEYKIISNVAMYCIYTAGGKNNGKVCYAGQIELYVKDSNGTNIYYVRDGKMIAAIESHNSFYMCNTDNDRKESFNAMFTTTSGSTFYFNNPAWRSNNNTGSQNGDSQQRVVVEQQRSLQPVNVWHQCYRCNGSRLCTLCGGLGWTYSGSSSDGRVECISCHGLKVCIECGGQGGRYEVEYR